MVFCGGGGKGWDRENGEENEEEGQGLGLGHGEDFGVNCFLIERFTNDLYIVV